MSWDSGLTWYTDIVTPPAGNVVSLDYLRDQHLRLVNDNAEDDKIERALESATAQAEVFTGRAIRDQTWAMVLTGFPSSGRFEVPYPPLVSVTSVQYVDEDGNTQTLATDQYRVLREQGDTARRSTIERAYNVSWPTTRGQRDAVTVTFRAGYVDTGQSPEIMAVPRSLVEGICLRAGELYKQRSDTVIGVGVTLTPAWLGSRTIWHDYKVY